MAVSCSPPLAGILIICLVQLIVVRCEIKESEIIKNLFHGYDATVLPNCTYDGSHNKVIVNLYARNFYIIDQSMNYIGAQLTFRQNWCDERLVYDQLSAPLPKKYVQLTDPRKIWKPDIFFSNSRRGHLNDIMEPNLLFRINPHGEVLYSRRVTLDLRCSTKTSMFPLNQIHCPIIIASYGYTTEDVTLEWKFENPIQHGSSISLPNYKIRLQETSYCASKTITGTYSCLKAVFLLERNYGAVFYKLYLPPLLLVLLGWLTFFMQDRRCKVRLSLLLVCLVLASLCCVHSAYQNPHRLIITAGDVWSGICLGFLTYALLHFVLSRNVPCLARICGYDDHKYMKKSSCNNETNTNSNWQKPMVPRKDEEEVLCKESLEKKKLWATLSRMRHLMTKPANRADIIARMMYPVAFIVANVIYWPAYQE